MRFQIEARRLQPFFDFCIGCGTQVPRLLFEESKPLQAGETGNPDFIDFGSAKSFHPAGHSQRLVIVAPSLVGKEDDASRDRFLFIHGFAP